MLLLLVLSGPALQGFQPAADGLWSGSHGFRAGVTSMSVASPRVSAVPGVPGRNDERAFMSDPRAFCSQQLRQHGAAFATGAFGGSTFVGDADALRRAAGTDAPGEPALPPPFARLPGVGVDGAAAADAPPVTLPPIS